MQYAGKVITQVKCDVIETLRCRILSQQRMSDERDERRRRREEIKTKYSFPNINTRDLSTSPPLQSPKSPHFQSAPSSPERRVHFEVDIEQDFVEESGGEPLRGFSTFGLDTSNPSYLHPEPPSSQPASTQATIQISVQPQQASLGSSPIPGLAIPIAAPRAMANLPQQAVAVPVGTVRANSLIVPLLEFTGGVHEDSERHINDFKRIMLVNHVAEEIHQMLFFATTLRGAAAEWYYSLPNNSIDTMQRFYDMFLEEFKPTQASSYWVNVLANTKQEANEPVKLYVRRLHEVF